MRLDADAVRRLQHREPQRGHHRHHRRARRLVAADLHARRVRPHPVGVVHDRGRQPQHALLHAVERGEVELRRGGREGDAVNSKSPFQNRRRGRDGRAVDARRRTRVKPIVGYRRARGWWLAPRIVRIRAGRLLERARWRPEGRLAFPLVRAAIREPSALLLAGQLGGGAAVPVHGDQRRGPRAVQRLRHRDPRARGARGPQLAGLHLGRPAARRPRDRAAADPGRDRQRRPAAVLLRARGGPLLLRRRRADRVHAGRPRDHARRAVRRRRDVHARGVGVRLLLHGVPGDRAGQLHGGGRPERRAQLDGAAVHELHDALEHRPRRRRAGQAVRARRW